MKHCLSILFFLMLIPFHINYLYAQGWKSDRGEVIIGTGASNFLGELGGKDGIGTSDLRDFDFPAIRPILHFGYNYRLSAKFSWKNDITLGNIYGNDQFTNEDFRNNRNVHFKSPIYEFSSVVNYSLLSESEGARYTLLGYSESRKSDFTFYRKIATDLYPYFFTGIAFFYFNPKAKYPEDGDIESMRGKWVKLKPLRTEGQGILNTREEYSLTQIAIPFGMGFKYAYSKDLSIGLEYGIRFTFTDYIDDTSLSYVDTQVLYNYHIENNDKETADLAVYFANPSNGELGNSITYPGQQRGDIRDNDAYMFAKITLYYKLSTGRAKAEVPKFQ